MTQEAEEILVDDTIDRRRRLCRCFKCGKVERCTPTTDFYTTKATGPYLVCTVCFLLTSHVTNPAPVAWIPEIEYPCTFCGGKLHLVRESATGEHGVVHVAPSCTKFDDTDLLEFMIENRRALGIPDPEEN